MVFRRDRARALLLAWCCWSVLDFCCGAGSSSGTQMQILRILMVGDSVTQGFSAVSAPRHGYNYELQNRLSNYFANERPGEYRVDVTNGGVGRTRISDNMPPRMHTMLKCATQAGFHYDWIIIMAGLNDCFRNKQPAKVFPKLLGMYDSALSTGARVLVLAILETNRTAKSDPLFERNRLDLNNRMRTHVSKLQAQGNTSVHFLDLNPWLPFHAMSPRDRKLYWANPVHPGPRGYDVLGYRIFVKLKQIYDKR